MSSTQVTRLDNTIVLKKKKRLKKVILWAGMWVEHSNGSHAGQKKTINQTTHLL